MRDIFLLDMDDTLLDFGRLERENVLSCLKAFSIPAGEREATRFHEINLSLWKALERGEIQRSQIVVRRFELLFEELNVRVDAKAVAEMYFQGLADRYFPFESMEEFLKALKERGKIYIVTNGAAYVQRRHIVDSGIINYADGVFISDEIGCNKPSWEYADYVAAHIENFSGERAVCLGDSLTSDKVLAERMGAAFVLFRGDEYGGPRAENYSEALRLMTE